MNKSMLLIFSALASVVSASSDAASLSLTKSCANGSYQIYLNGESTVFDTFSLHFSAVVGDFTNLDIGFDGFVPRGLGEPFTYVNRYLGAHPVQGGMGLTLVGEQSTAKILAFDATKLGGKVDTSGQPGGRLFLANLMLPQPGVWVGEVRLIAGGQTVQALSPVIPLTGIPCLPEPSSAFLIAVGIAVGFSRKINNRLPRQSNTRRLGAN